MTLTEKSPSAVGTSIVELYIARLASDKGDAFEVETDTDYVNS